jgi:hypothetical protein
VPVEVALADGTKIVLANPLALEDDVVATMRDDPNGVMSLRSDEGTYRVSIRNVVYVRTID